jgi:hypothetical protein
MIDLTLPQQTENMDDDIIVFSGRRQPSQPQVAAIRASNIKAASPLPSGIAVDRRSSQPLAPPLSAPADKFASFFSSSANPLFGNLMNIAPQAQEVFKSLE